MSRVTVQIPPPLRPFANGAAETIVEAATVADALQQAGQDREGWLARILTPEGQLRPYVNVFVGDRNVRQLDGLETRLKDGDILAIIPAVAGG